MDTSSMAAHINWLAILVAALAGFAVGGVWYGPLFSKAWIRESGVNLEKARSINKPKLFGTVFVLNLIAAFSLAMFIGENATWRFGLFAGFMAGLTFVSTALAVIYLFEARSLRLWLINAGYQVVIFSVMGVILGAWSAGTTQVQTQAQGVINLGKIH
jgi:fluoride ion exporter CrcB/FEX